MGDRRRNVLLVGLPLAAAVATTLAYVIWGIAEDWRSTPLTDAIYNATFIAAGISCLARGLISTKVRLAWLAFGLGLIGWGLGDVYWSAVYSDAKRVPYPSLADAGYLMAPLMFFIGIPLLIKDRLGKFTLGAVLDAAIGALAVTALGTAVLAPALEGLNRGDTAAVVTNIAYPILDLLLLAMIAGSLVLVRPRDAWNLYLVALGLLIWAAADIEYLFLEASSAYEPGWIDVTWQIGAILIAAGGIKRTTPALSSRPDYRSVLALPILFTAIAVGVLVWDHFEPIRGISIALAAATLIAVGARLVLSYRENDRLVSELESDNVTDALTRMGNRRRLFDDLERALDERTGSRGGYLFALFDLDGFKSYNDVFGHPAGDALLRRLGGHLMEAVAPHGTAYRLGGDEFCVLVALRSRRPASVFEAAREALREDGEGFAIGASGGWMVLMPGATTAEEALRDVDRRMYEDKASHSSSSRRQTQDVLMRIFHESEPSLGDHSEGVAELCRAMGRRLRLDAEEQDVLVRAAEMHDVGKIAIPDDVLHKPGPLSDSEWDLMRRHTVIGERILGATPALRPVAELVRASHERWDGTGYPDGIAGEEIPLGARIISICDTFDAMTSPRSYKEACSAADALAEIRRCAGRQFDPELASLFCEMVETGGVEGEPQTAIDETIKETR